MSKYMALFQIGPVQDFIQTARRTQDYWAGSFLLSYLNARAIAAFGEDAVVFPAVQSVALYREARENRLPWPPGLKAEAYAPSIPNRFFAVVEGAPEALLEEARRAVGESWKEIADAVRNDFVHRIKEPRFLQQGEKSLSGASAATPGAASLDLEVWEEQIERRSFEVLYAWREMQDSDYAEEYRRTEALLGARKASRVFAFPPAREGYPCSLCGLRVSLGPEGLRRREDLLRWWKEGVRGTSQLRTKFRENEHLCAVCVVKRLAPSWVFKAELDVPSTGTMAVAGYQNRLWEAGSLAGGERIAKAAGDFRQKAREAADALGESRQVKLPPYFGSPSSPPPVEVDGRWFFESTYRWGDERDPDEREKKKDKLLPAFKALNELTRAYRSFCRSSAPGSGGLPAPSRYYALVTADGDSMGELLGSLESREKHDKVSRTLAGFAAEHAPEVFEKRRPGYVLYWGGDEGVALVSLEDLFGALTDLRRAWRKHVEEALGERVSLTLSAGAVIVHYQYPLRAALREVYATVEEAKEVSYQRKEKDAWAVKVLRRSGGPSLARAKWRYPIEGGGFFKPLDLLGDYLKAYREGWLSPRWLGDLRAEEPVLGDPPGDSAGKDSGKWIERAHKLFNHEARRLLLRHTDVRGDARRKAKLEGLVDATERLNRFAGKSPRRHRDLSALLDLAHYVAKGGGR